MSVSENNRKNVKNLYLACPHIIEYALDIQETSVQKRDFSVKKSAFSIMGISPSQIIPPTFSSPLVTIVGHKNFKVFDYCLQKVVNEGEFRASFHHTISLPQADYMYASVNDLSLVIWSIKPENWYLSCYEDKIKEGKYKA